MARRSFSRTRERVAPRESAVLFIEFGEHFVPLLQKFNIIFLFSSSRLRRRDDGHEGRRATVPGEQDARPRITRGDRGRLG